MGNNFGIPGLGTKSIHGERDVNERDLEACRPSEKFGTVISRQPKSVTKKYERSEVEVPLCYNLHDYLTDSVL